MAKSVPVYILTGFLGAGKTTLLQTLLQHSKAHGRRPAVLMNEFGNESVDTVLLQNAAVPVVDLVEGCVCCTVRGSLTLALLQLLEQFQPDQIFLEATGVAIPLEIVDVLFDEELQDRVHLAGVLTLVDATNFPLHLMPGMELSAIQRTMIEQVRHADALLVSKTDLVGFDRRLALESVLSELNPDAPMIKVVKGKVNADELLSIRTRKHTVRRGASSARIKKWTRGAFAGKRVRAAVEAQTSFGTLQTLHYSFRAPVDTDRFYEMLRGLPDTIYRGKGFYRDSEGGYCYEFQYTPNLPMIDPRPDLAEQEAFAIFIGEKLEEQGIRKLLAACEVRE